MTRFNKKNLVLVALFILIVPTYLLRIRYSLWYDEAAVVENAKNLRIGDLHLGLNWLQTIPLAYFLMAKLILHWSLGVEVLRVISMLSLFASVTLTIKYLIPSTTKWIAKFTFAVLVLCNPISITYGTMVKPYALDFLIVVGALILYKREIWTPLILLALAAPLFSNSSVLFVLALAVVMLIFHRDYIHAGCIIFANLISVTISLYFTSNGTKNMMSQVWFGDDKQIGIQSLKSAIGNLGWFSVSGLGAIPEGGSGTNYLIFSLSILIFLLFVAFQYRSELSLILFTVLSFHLIAQFLFLLPAAGRLMLGSAILLWLVLILRVDQYKEKVKMSLIFVLIGMVFFSTFSNGFWLKTSGNSHLKEIASSIKEIPETSQIYVNLWAGPGSKYYLRHFENRFSSNLVWLNEKAEILGCRSATLKQGDLLIFDFIGAETLRIIGRKEFLKPLKISRGSAIFSVSKDFTVRGLDSAVVNLSCEYAWSNPQYPVREPSNAA
jgi:hypothetical protein